MSELKSETHRDVYIYIKCGDGRIGQIKNGTFSPFNSIYLHHDYTASELRWIADEIERSKEL